MIRRTEAQWMQLVNDFKSSGLSLTAWCGENKINKSSISRYIQKYNKQANSKQQEWGVAAIPKSLEKSSILLKIGAVTWVQKINLSLFKNIIQ